MQSTRCWSLQQLMDLLGGFHFGAIRNNGALNTCVQGFVSMPLFKLKDIHSLHWIVHSELFMCQSVCYVLGLVRTFHRQVRRLTFGRVHCIGGEKQQMKRQINKQGNCSWWPVFWRGNRAVTEESSWWRKKWDLSQENQCISQGSPEKEDQDDVCIDKFILRRCFMQLSWLASPKILAEGPAGWRAKEGPMLQLRSEGYLLTKHPCMGRSVLILARPSTD